MSSQKVIVFGATGAVGTSLVQILSEMHPDWQIDAVTRSLDPPSRLAEMKLPNVNMVQGDAFDKDKVLSLTENYDMIYSCIGFHRYEAKYWAQHWPTVVDNLLSAVTDGKKKLVFCDNLYAYGPGTNISPSTPCVKASMKTKPAIRASLRQTFEEHMSKYPDTLTVIGGSDFFGPYSTNASFLGDAVAGKLVQGASALAVGSADKTHDFCYTVDFAKALAVASISPKAYNRFWICPHAIHGKSMRQIAQDIANKVNDKDKPVKITVLGKGLVYIMSPFVGFCWEMIEMLPFWTKDYTVDDSDFIKEFGVEATPYDEALDALVTFYQSQQQKQKE